MSESYDFWLNAWKDSDLKHIENRIEILSKRISLANSDLYLLTQENKALWYLKGLKEK